MAERMQRKQIYIDPEQGIQLKEMAARLGVPESSLIRRGIDMTLRAVPVSRWQPDLWQRELEFARSVPAVDNSRTWSREELYDR